MNRVLIIFSLTIIFSFGTLYSGKYYHFMDVRYYQTKQYYDQNKELLSFGDTEITNITTKYLFKYEYSNKFSFENNIDWINKTVTATGGFEYNNSNFGDITLSADYHPVYDTTILEFKLGLSIPSKFVDDEYPLVSDKVYKGVLSVRLYRKMFSNFFWAVEVGYKYQQEPYKSQVNYDVSAGFNLSDLFVFNIEYYGNRIMLSNVSSNIETLERLTNPEYSIVKTGLSVTVNNVILQGSYILPVSGRNNYFTKTIQIGVGYEY